MKTGFLGTALLATILLAGTQTAGARQDWDAVEMTVHPVSGSVSYIEGSGGNIGLFVGDDGVFLIDDQYAPLTEKIVAAIRTVSSEPIRFLVNTHLHPDHTGGNENFGKMGTMIFGHENTRKQMAISGYAEEPPLITFSEDMTFHINGETVHVFKTPNAHTNGDVYIKFESANVIHTGDVYRTTSYPYIDTNNGGSFLGTIKAYDLLIEVSDADTTILPGHGVISNVEEVRAFRDMMLVIRDRVAAAIRAGKSLEEAQAAGLTAEYDERWDSGRRIGSSATLIESVYTEMVN
jgi:glyoxylase-like metal-dependent hydrolase (beta-lactamase superfamily II)